MPETHMTADVQELSQQMLLFWQQYAEMLEVMEAYFKDQPAWGPRRRP